ncbi:MAG: hypothetical protein TREMPRED_003204 [Tremellales sp. Tagirdzhanova-0007]|nr:MAG: hypothetical protein TREMPRED_003204 [Tremellales sp. Tagirdzhanova-0007]
MEDSVYEETLYRRNKEGRSRDHRRDSRRRDDYGYDPSQQLGPDSHYLRKKGGYLFEEPDRPSDSRPSTHTTRSRGEERYRDAYPPSAAPRSTYGASRPVDPRAYWSQMSDSRDVFYTLKDFLTFVKCPPTNLIEEVDRAITLVNNGISFDIAAGYLWKEIEMDQAKSLTNNECGSLRSLLQYYLEEGMDPASEKEAQKGADDARARTATAMREHIARTEDQWARYQAAEEPIEPHAGRDPPGDMNLVAVTSTGREAALETVFPPCVQDMVMCGIGSMRRDGPAYDDSKMLSRRDQQLLHNISTDILSKWPPDEASFLFSRPKVVSSH